MEGGSSLRVLACVVILATFVTGGAQAQPTDDLLIMPGVRIGPIKIGMNITDATKIFGTPKPATTKLVSVVLPVPDGSLAFGWEPSVEAKRQGAEFQGFHVITDQAGMIYEVQSPFDNRYHTSEGLHVGSKASEVTAVFGAPSRQLTQGHERYYVYDQRGIAFLLQNDRKATNYDLVNGIWVFAGRAAP
jgi:hypothetical protein